MTAITVSNLSKTYPSGKRALDGIGFDIAAGEVFGFLGPNGAGKTTTVKLLNGMLTPSEGTASVFGIDPAAQPDKVHGISGVITEHAQMYDNLTGLQNLEFYAAVFGLTAAEGKKRAIELLERLDLSVAKHRKLSAYSTGMRQRLSIARAMIHNPKALFLDEPTAGLDPESAHNVNIMIQNLAQEHGTTVFLCTHQLRYAQEICTRYGLIDNGIMLAEGTLSKLSAHVQSGVKVTIKADRYPDGLRLTQKGDYCETEVDTESDIAPIVKKIVESGGNVYHVSAAEPSLEDIYFALIERKKKECEVSLND